MTLKDTMADDIDAVFLNEDEFADAATFMPKDEISGFDCIVVMSDPQPGYIQIDGGVEDRRPAVALMNRAIIRTGIAQMKGNERDPIRGDKIAIPSGAYVGTWKVVSAQADDGGAVMANVVWSEMYTLGAKDTREVRS
jgi:hypothetical protein